MKMVQIWHCKWGLESEIQEHTRQGSLYMTAARLEENLTKTYEKGFDAGRQQGRIDFRKDIEEGNIDPRPWVPAEGE